MSDVKPIAVNIHPRISIVMVARDEEEFIAKSLRTLIAGTYPVELLEVLVIDGRSDDRTVEVVQNLIEANHWPIRILDNPQKLPCNGLNIGISHATGDYIARADAHSEYPPNYLETLLRHARENPDVDNVGGMWDIQPSSSNYISTAIAAAYSHRFATGNALYRVGVNKPTYVDTVPFGFFRREAFEKYGMYDTDLIRNEDGEFNHRIIRNGGKILLVPDLKITYYARSSLSMFARTFYQYGLFKPLAQIKLGRPVNYRQFAPLIFTVLLTALIISAITTANFIPFAAASSITVIYLFTSTICAFDAARSRHKSRLLVPGICLAFWTMHFSFVIGYIRGIYVFLVCKRRFTEVPKTR